MTDILPFPIQFRSIEASDSPQEAIRLAKLKVLNFVQQVEAGNAVWDADKRDAVSYINQLCEKYDQPLLEVELPEE